MLLKFPCKTSSLIDVGVSACAGLLGEAVSGLLWVPGDIISQRLQIRSLPGYGNPHNTSMVTVARSILEVEGIKGLYRSYWASLMIYAPGSAIWWASYEFYKNRFHYFTDHLTCKENENVDSIVHLVSGAFAGFTSSLVLNPLEVARTRYQTIEATSVTNAEIIQRGFVSLFVDVGRKEKLSGLYRGFLPRLLVSVPGSAISVVSYEFVKRICKLDNDLL